MIKTVNHLISKHELGGDADQNLLKDADSLSFFETNAEKFATEFIKELGKEKIKQKFDWMYERISSPQAKEWAKPMYEKYIKLLHQQF